MASDPTARAVRNLVLLQRVANGLDATARAQLDALIVELADALARFDPTSVQPRYRPGRLAKLLEIAETLISEHFRGIRQGLTAGAVEIGKQQAAFAASVLPGESRLVRVSSAVREVVRTKPLHGETLEHWIERAEIRAFQDFRQQMALGVANSASLAQMRTTLGGEWRKRVRNHLRGIARTATTGIAAHSHLLAFEQNRDVVDQVEFVATLDARTTIVCARWDGQRWAVGDPGIQVPPLHFNCRSTLTPVIDYRAIGLEPPPSIGQRAARGGPVSASTRYREWFRGLSASEQDDIIGPARARLFRRGELSFDQMIGRDNRVLTLAELTAA